MTITITFIDLALDILKESSMLFFHTRFTVLAVVQRMNACLSFPVVQCVYCD